MSLTVRQTLQHFSPEVPNPLITPNSGTNFRVGRRTQIWVDVDYGRRGEIKSLYQIAVQLSEEVATFWEVWWGLKVEANASDFTNTQN